MTLLNYKSEIPAHVVRAAQEIEETRQAILRREATPKTLAYARFLSACENDATLIGGRFKHKDKDVAREWPFLAPLINAENA